MSMPRKRYKNLVNKTLLNKKKLLEEANKCNFFFTLFEEKKWKEAFEKLYQGLGLDFKKASKYEKNQINERFKKALIRYRPDVSLLRSY